MCRKITQKLLGLSAIICLLLVLPFCIQAADVQPALPDENITAENQDASKTDLGKSKESTTARTNTSNNKKNAPRQNQQESVTSAAAATTTPASDTVANQSPTPSVSVSEFGGGAVVSLPIIVPPGRNNIAPSLNISYRRGINGWLGVGWSLDIGSIQRSSKFGVNYSSNVFVALKDGEFADLVVRPDWGSNYYGSKVESSFSKFYYDASNEKWVVTFKNGTKFHYGSSESSRIMGGSANEIFQWCLDLIEDSNGNYLRIEYFKDGANRAVYPSRIIYTNHNENGVSAEEVRHGEVRFFLEERPDLHNYAIGTAFVQVRYRLKTINVRTNALKEVRAYKLNYVNSPVTSASILNSVRQYGTDAIVDDLGNITGGSALPPVTMLTNTDDHVTQIAAAGGMFLEPCTSAMPPYTDPCWIWGTCVPTLSCGYIPTEVIVGHFDNDRKVDYMWIDLATNTRYVYLNNGDGTFREQTTFDNVSYIYYAFMKGDFNGDGVIDYLLYSPLSPYVYVYLNKGDGTFDPVKTVNLGQTFPGWDFHTGDYDGNGKLDFMWIQKSTNSRAIYFADVNGTTGLNFNRTVKTINTKSYGDTYVFLPGDFNGDGKLDYMWLNVANNESDVYLNTGNTSADFTLVNSPSDGMSYLTGYQLLIADVNGDGKTDYIWYRGYISGGTIFGKYTYLSKGDGKFSTPVYEIGDTDVVWGSLLEYGKLVTSDFNGDGKVDLLATCTVMTGTWEYPYYSLSYRYYAGKGDGTFVRDGGGFPIYSNQPGDADLLPKIGFHSGDINGDNIDDFIMSSIVGEGSIERPSYTTITLTNYTRGSSAPIYALENVNNGLGGSTSFSYRYSSEYQNTFLPISFPLVETITTNDGNGNESIVTYNYAAGLIDLSTRDFRGFGVVSSTNPDNVTTTTWYNQTENLKGRAEITTQTDSTGFIFGRTTTDWTAVTLSNNAVFAKMSKTISESRDLDTEWIAIQKIFTFNDTNGNLEETIVSQIDASGADATNVDAITTKTEYSNVGTSWLWVPTKVTVSGSLSGKMRETSFTYYPDGKGNIKEEIKWLDGGTNPVVTFTYDSYGNRKTTKDPMGIVVSTFVYDMPTNTYPVEVTAANTGTVTHIVQNQLIDYGLGKATKTIDENGRATISVYDVFGRLKSVNSPDGGQVSYSYYLNESLYYTVTTVKEGVTENTIDAYTYYDGFGRPIRKLGLGENGKSLVTETIYDQMGRIIENRGPYYSGADEYHWVKTAYDDRSRPVKLESPSGQYGVFSSRITYSGLTTTTTDPDGRKKTQIKDYLGRVIKIVENVGGTPINTIYSYNAAGDLQTITDHLNNVIRIYYDTLGRKTGVQDPDRGTWTYAYDSNNNMTTRTDARGITLTFSYDALNRVTRKAYSTGKPPVIYTYDNLTIPNGLGRLYSVTNDAMTKTVNAYDAMGRLLSSSKMISGNTATFTTQLTYDLAGRLETVTYPDNTVIKYNYYPGTGLIYNVADMNSGTEYARYSSYEPSGKIGQINHGNGSMTRYTYDVWSGRLMGLVSAAPGNAPADDYQNKSYTYYRSGDVKTITDNKRNITFTYTYDTLHRLKTETNNGGLPGMVLSYNAIGNITQKVVGANTMVYTYDAVKKHAVKKVTFNGTAYTFAYDANGNMTTGYDFTDSGSIGQRTMTYDADNNLSNIVYVKGGVTSTAAMSYDEAGERVKKVGAATNYYVGEHFQINGGVPIKHITAGNQKLVVIWNSNTYYFHKDHLGSSAVMSDVTGQVMERTDYLPFGAVREFSGTSVTNYRYTGQELDPESGLYYYKSRYYDSALARFITPDGIYPDLYNPQALNAYSYCLNNPMLYVDPNGHSWGVGAIIGAIIGVVIGAITAGIQSDWDIQAVVTGAVIGGISGAVSGGVFGVLGGSGGGLLGGTVADVAIFSFSEVTYASVIAGAAAGAAGGAVQAGLSTAVYGGNIGDAVLQGVAIGALSGAVFAGIGKPNVFWRVPAYALAGGALSLISDRNFIEGAIMAAAMAAAAYTYYKTYGVPLNGQRATAEGDKNRVDSTEDSRANQQGRNINHVGKARSSDWLVGEAGEVMTGASKKIPWLNQMAEWHDWLDTNGFSKMGAIGSGLNYGTIVPCYILTVQGGMGYYMPITASIWFGADDN